MYFYYVQNIRESKKTHLFAQPFCYTEGSTSTQVLSQRFLFRNGHVERSFVHVAV
jgi:hypothetical protein